MFSVKMLLEGVPFFEWPITHTAINTKIAVVSMTVPCVF